jgi:nitrogen fixation protein NifQ
MLQPVAPRLDWALLEGRMRSRNDEIDDLMALLLDHADRAAGPKAELYHVAWQIACASLGDQHLWQDLGLPSRDALSLLIGRWFPALAARNADNMKWKKFFYRQLCLKEDILICKSPSCAGCPDVGLCFGPETASPVQLAEAKA